MNGSEVWEWRFKPQGFAPEILVVSFRSDGLVSKVTRVPDPLAEAAEAEGNGSFASTRADRGTQRVVWVSPETFL
jgi:hypothetical protein